MEGLQKLEAALRQAGIDPDKIEPIKSDFQKNQEMAAMLLTILMGEMDSLRARIEALEGGTP